MSDWKHPANERLAKPLAIFMVSWIIICIIAVVAYSCLWQDTGMGNWIAGGVAIPAFVSVGISMWMLWRDSKYKPPEG